jgi:hypothetical protein
MREASRSLETTRIGSESSRQEEEKGKSQNGVMRFSNHKHSQWSLVADFRLQKKGEEELRKRL